MRTQKIKNALTRALVVCLIVSMLSSAAFAASGKVTADYLNVRSEPSTAATVVGVLAEGATVDILGSENGWYKIESNGLSGYVYAAYINGGSVVSGATINESMVNIRSGASTASSILANVDKGTAVTVTGEDGDWYKVEYNGQSAYVYKDYVTLDSDGSASSSASSTVSTRGGTVNESYVRLRSGASLSASIRRLLNRGETLTVTGEDGDWYKVSDNGTDAYVYKAYLTLDGSDDGESKSDESESGEAGTINEDYVRFRAGASTASSILAVFPRNADVTVLATEGDWYKVRYNGQTGYAYKSYVTLGDDSGSTGETVQPASGTGTIRADYVRVRSGPSTSSSILASVNTGTTMTITGKTDEWYQVSYNGQTGYVYSAYLADSSAAESSPETSTDAGEAVAAKAREYLGVPYVYGGTSPSGFDCSGLVYYVFRQLGYSVYRTASAQYRNGVYVERSELQPGDIILFHDGSGTSIGHVGIYIGNGELIHASYGSGVVRINRLDESYFDSHYYGARRIVE